MALIACAFSALGTAIGSALENMQGFQLIMNFLVMPIFFLSGALYPLTNLPTAFSIVVSLDPLAYGVDGLRAALIGVSHFGPAVDAVVLVVVACILLVDRQPPVLTNSGLKQGRGPEARAHKGARCCSELMAKRVEATSMDECGSMGIKRLYTSTGRMMRMAVARS